MTLVSITPNAKFWTLVELYCAEHKLKILFFKKQGYSPKCRADTLNDDNIEKLFLNFVGRDILVFPILKIAFVDI